MKRGVISALLVLVGALALGLPVRAEIYLQSGMQITNPLPTLLVQQDGGLILATSSKLGRWRSRVSFYRLGPSGEAELIGSAELDAARMEQGGKAKLASFGTLPNRPPHQQFLLVPYRGDYLLIYEQVRAWKGRHQVHTRGYLIAQRLGDGEVIGELDTGELMAEAEVKPRKVSIAGIVPGEGGTVQLYLNAYYTMGQARDIFRVELSLPDLAPLGRPEKVSEVCWVCLVQAFPGQVLINTMGNPLAKVMSPDGAEGRWVAFTNLFFGSGEDDLRAVWGLDGVLPRYYPFGEGWIANLLEPFRAWVRRGEEWELVAKREPWPYEPLVVRYDSYGRWQRVVRLPTGWRLGASLAPDYGLVFSTEGEYGILRRDGSVLFLRESEQGLTPFRPSPEVAERIAELAEPTPGGHFKLREEVSLTSQGEGGSDYYLDLLAGTERFAVLVREYRRSERWELVMLDSRGQVLWRQSFIPQESLDRFMPPADWPEGVSSSPPMTLGGALLGEDAYFGLLTVGKRLGNYLPEEERIPVKETYLGAGVVRLRADGRAELVAYLNLGELLQRAGAQLPPAYLVSRGRLIEIKEGYSPSFFHLTLIPRPDGKSLLVRFSFTVGKEGYVPGSRQQKLGEKLRGTLPWESYPFTATVGCVLEVERGEITDCAKYKETSRFGQFVPPTITPELGRVVMGKRLGHTVLIQGKAAQRESGLGRPMPLGLSQGPELYGYSEQGYVGSIRFSPRVQIPDQQLYPRERLPYAWEDLCRWRQDGSIDVCAALPVNVGLMGMVPTDPPWLSFIVVPEKATGRRPDYLLVSPTGKVLRLEVMGKSLSLTQVEAPELVEATRLILGSGRWLPVDPQITI